MTPEVAAILVAVIGMIGGVWAAYVSNKNKNATKTITDVLANTKGPIDSLDQVIKVLQDELVSANQRHENERKYFISEIERLKADHARDRKEWQQAETRLQEEINELLEDKESLLEEIANLKDQLNQLEERVRRSLDKASDDKKGTVI